jgi:hypothetical protein
MSKGQCSNVKNASMHTSTLGAGQSTTKSAGLWSSSCIASGKANGERKDHPCPTVISTCNDRSPCTLKAACLDTSTPYSAGIQNDPGQSIWLATSNTCKIGRCLTEGCQTPRCCSNYSWPSGIISNCMFGEETKGSLNRTRSFHKPFSSPGLQPSSAGGMSNLT